MKKLIGIILILITAPGGAQELNLYCRKANVIASMHQFPEYRITVKTADYLEYQKGETAIGYRFFRDSLNIFYGQWVCYQAYYTVSTKQGEALIQKKEKCKCWIPIIPDEWEFINNVYDGTVIVNALRQDESVTFIYQFKIDKR